MTIRRVQGFNVPYTYPDHNVSGQKQAETNAQETVEKSPKNLQKETSQVAEVKQQATAGSKELNSKFENVHFKGEIIGLEPYVKDPKTETSGFALPEVDDEVL